PLPDLDQLQGFANDRMLDLLDRSRFLERRVFQQEAVNESAMNIDVNILVDRRGDEKPRMLAVIGGQICAAAAQRNSKWRPGDDHDESFRGVAITCRRVEQ